MVPFLLGTAYALYHFRAFNPVNCLLMLVSLLFIDMATTAINNLLDYKRAHKKEGFGFETHNAIVKYNMSQNAVLTTIFVLVAISVTFGFLLFLNTNIIVLILGALSFLVGVTYSFGPIPISRTPFGEIFSGGFMGLVIPFLAVYIHVFDQNLIGFGFSNAQYAASAVNAVNAVSAVNAATGGLSDYTFLNFSFKFFELLKIFLISVPVAAGIANIMLANNICDMEDDLANKRYTLPIFIGKRNALYVFAGLYFAGYASLILAVILGGAPLMSLVVLLTIPLLIKNLRTFFKVQSKAGTFSLSVNNLLLVNVVLIVTVAAGAALRI